MSLKIKLGLFLLLQATCLKASASEPSAPDPSNFLAPTIIARTQEPSNNADLDSLTYSPLTLGDLPSFSPVTNNFFSVDVGTIHLSGANQYKGLTTITGTIHLSDVNEYEGLTTITDEN
ncbi:hypothetical protein [Candidatus Paracaedibacter symbiosus]|uniref:hypothetical protein n=1 Tax=Candidatus Paracaedibacter symbiosus TaxID=244582 RepID=UPI00050951C2|nr:hypothetical protein [Candidatus Paracaedibacter symbiosus]